MEMCMTTGARYFPQSGSVAVPGHIWFRRPRTAPSRAFALYAGRLLRRACLVAHVNPTGIDLLVTDRMHKSASEP